MSGARRTLLRAATTCAAVLVFLGLGLLALESVAWLLGYAPLAEDPAYRARARHTACQFGSDAVEQRCVAEPLAEPRPSLIVAIGGSNVQGQLRTQTQLFPALLQRELDRTRPGAFRVLNRGRICRDSIYVRECAERMLRERPDFLVVYAGHNDYANWGFRDPERLIFLEEHAWLYRGVDALSQTRAFSMLRALLGLSLPSADQGSSEVSDAEFARAGAVVLDHWTANARDVIERAREQGTEVILVTLVSNLYEFPIPQRGWAEVVSRLEGLSPRQERWRAAYRRGIDRFRAGEHEAALAAFSEARDIAPQGRAPSQLNVRIRELAAEYPQVHLVDLEAIVVREGLREGIGCNFFGGEDACDQFHMNTRAHRLLARALARVVRARQAAAPR